MIAILSTMALLAASPQHPASLAVIDKAPPFTLLDQNQREVHFDKLRGQVLLVGFVFTTCNGSCPATTHRMANVQDELRRRGVLPGGKVKLLSVTLDPERDTPAALQRYIQLFDLDIANWSFLTGPADRVQTVIRDWGMWTKQAANGQLDHPSRVYLVDAAGNIREIYNLAFLKAEWVADDIESLLKDQGSSSGKGR